VDFLLALLADESPGVRSYAAWGLDGKESQRILEPLVAGLCDSDAYVRAYALNSLESIFRNSEDYPFSMKAVIPLLSDSSALVRAAAVEIMQHCKDQNVFDYIVTALNDKNPRVRASSATTLMMIGRENEDTASHLMGAAEDTDEKVRKSVAHALACTQFWLRDRNPTVIKTIGDLLRDPVDSVRIAAAKGLSDINDDMAAKVLVSALNDVNPKVRRYALLGLDAAGNPESFNRLLDTLQHGTDEERKGAAEALGASDNPRAFQPLVDVLRNKDNNYLVRMSAASALGNLGDPNAVIPLIENLKDESGDVRDAVSSALEWIADERCTDALIEALEDEYKYVRASACQGLEKIGDRKAIEPIRRLLNDEDEYVRSVAKKALKSFKVDV
jgi:HEAT repeat protein